MNQDYASLRGSGEFIQNGGADSYISSVRFPRGLGPRLQRQEELAVSEKL